MSTYDATDFALAVSAATGAILGRAKALAPASWQRSASVLTCAQMLTPLGFAAELLNRIADRERTSLAAKAESIGELLVSKNAAYGNSALDPIRVYSRAPAAEQIRVRIDDKLSRLARGARAGEDVEVDLLGYLVLLLIAEGEDGMRRVGPPDSAECPGCNRRADARGEPRPPPLGLDDHGRFREHYHRHGRCVWSGHSYDDPPQSWLIAEGEDA